MAQGEAFDVNEEEAQIAEEEAFLASAEAGVGVAEASFGVVGVSAAPGGEIRARARSLGAAGRIIKVLREKSRMTPGGLIAEVGAARRTFYRALNLLKDSGVVVKDDGEWCWYEYLGTREFSSEFEARQMMDHSGMIASGLSKLQNSGAYNVVRQAEVESYITCGLSHLRTGYPEIYERYERIKEIQARIDDVETELRGRISSRLPSVVVGDFSGYLVDRVVYELRRMLEGRGLRLVDRFMVEEDICSLDGFSFDSSDFGVVRDFIVSELGDEGNTADCGVFLELLVEYREFKAVFEGDLSSLVSCVENGTPLAGKCGLCPKVRIMTPD